MDVKNKVVVITGASERIGRLIALKLAKLGAIIVIHYYKDEFEALKTVELIKQLGGSGSAIQADLTTMSDLNGLVTNTLKLHNRWDVLINCASVFKTVAIDNVDEELWDKDHFIHAKAPFFLTKALYLHKKEREEEGVVINLTDTQVYKSSITRPSYNLSKMALHNQVQVLGKTLAPFIRVNAVAPGAIIPSHPNEEPYFDALKEKLPLKRLATGEDVVDAVLFLIQNESITGVSVAVDAGQTLL